MHDSDAAVIITSNLLQMEQVGRRQRGRAGTGNRWRVGGVGTAWASNTTEQDILTIQRLEPEKVCCLYSTDDY